MKHTLCALCAVAMFFCSAIPNAFAATPTEAPTSETTELPTPSVTEIVAEETPPEKKTTLYPTEVRETAENGVARIEKIYHLTSLDDPGNIPTEDFEREGKTYTLLDILKQAQVESDTQDYIEVVTLDSATKDMEEILKMLEPELEVQTEDGYHGILSLDHTTIGVEAAGYKTSSRTVTATRTYPNLSGADVSLIPKTVEENGRTLTLADVKWQNAATTQTDGYDMALRYTATATYTGTATSQYATGYVVTASYGGEVTRISTDVTTYIAVFSSTDGAPATTVTEGITANPETDSSTFPVLWLALPLGLGAAGAAGYFGYRGYKHYINKKRGYE